MTTRQFTGKTVAEATDLALETLGLKREEVEIAVVNPGRAGILGFGGEPAVIAVTTLIPETTAATRQAAEPRAPEAPRRRVQPRPVPAEEPSADGTAEPGAAKTGEERARVAEPEGAVEAEDLDAGDEGADDLGESEDGEEGPEGEDDDYRPVAVEPPSRPADVGQAPPPGEPDTEAEQLATEILDFFLGTMGVVATTFVREDAPERVIAFEIEGEDAGLLIGRRGETLQALQFLVNLIVNKQLGRQVYITIDVEGYRERRQESLRSLAERTAERVASSGRPAQLQPMPAAERRVIHMTLAEHPDVRTESKGDGDQRRVVVLPRR